MRQISSCQNCHAWMPTGQKLERTFAPAARAARAKVWDCSCDTTSRAEPDRPVPNVAMFVGGPFQMPAAA